MPEESILFIFDTVVLSNFAISGGLDVLKTRYRGRGAIPTEVLVELAAGMTQGYEELRQIESLLDKHIFRELSLTRNERKVYGTLLRNLGSGEASCIAAVQSRGGVVVTDDRMARSICQELELGFTGTIGILVAACRDRKITPERADEILEKMIVSGFFSPVSRIRDIL